MNIKFNKSAQPVESVREEPPRRKHWDRWIYIAILALLLGAFLKWILVPLFYNSAEGILLQQQYDVDFAYNIRVLSYNVEEGQEVHPGDTLFFYERYGDENMPFGRTQDSIQFILEQNKSKRDLIALDGQIEKRALFLKNLQKRLQYWKGEKIQKRSLVYLGTISSNELAGIDRSIDEVQYLIATTHSENQALRQERRLLQQNNAYYQNLGDKSVQLAHQTRAFVSPVKGAIDRLRTPVQQICYSKDLVTSIVYPQFFVRAYIDLADLGDFEVGDKVKVILPYGSHSLNGKVNKMFAVSELKDHLISKETYAARPHGIVMEVVPLDTTRWARVKVSNIPVKVKKSRF